MESKLLGELVGHGVLGIAVVVLGWVIRVLYLQNNKFITERDALHIDYQTKYNLLVEKYVAKAEEWAEKNRELASSTSAVLDALLRRRGDKDV